MNYVSQENLDNIVKGLSNKIAMSVSNGALIGDTTPVGTVISFMGTQAPLFYLICDGTIYNIAEYQELADFIEAQFGAVNYFGGDGVDTFAVPDLQGEFLRGTGTNSHTNQGSGENVGVHQDGTQNIYLHLDQTLLYMRYNSSSIKSFPENPDSLIEETVDAYIGGGTKGSYSTSDITGYISRPTNTSVLYCIKYTKAVIPSEYEDGTPVGRVVFDSILRDGYIKANGAQIEDATIAIPRLLSFVQKYSSQILASDQATYDANVGLYMYDSNNDILTLPNYIGRFLEGGNSVTSIEAGLPNIKGRFHSYVPYAWSNPSGAFSNFSQGSTMFQNVSGTSASIIEFDAYDSNSIYSDTVTTVQPSSITLIPQIRY